MIGIRVDVGKLDQQLGRLAQAVEARFFERFSPTAQSLIEREQRRHFAEGKAPDGTPWKQSKRALRQKGMTLVDTGRMRAAVTTGGQGAVREKGKTYLLVGVRLDYAKIHQLGGEVTLLRRGQTLVFGPGGRFAKRSSFSKRKGGSVRIRAVQIGPRTIKIPARPFLGTSENSRRELGRAARYTLDKVLREAAG